MMDGLTGLTDYDGSKDNATIKNKFRLMKLERYEMDISNDSTTFEFINEGIKGQIPKIIQFTNLNSKNLYNLAFGDKDPLTGYLNNTVISNNGDSEKVLATVVGSVYAFTKKYPDAIVYATGSTEVRNRLYRMGISKFLHEVKVDFEIFGLIEDRWEMYTRNVDYEAFIVKRIFTTFIS